MGPRFRYLEDARRYVDDHREVASLAIRGPDGSWEYTAPRTRHYSSREIHETRTAPRALVVATARRGA